MSQPNEITQLDRHLTSQAAGDSLRWYDIRDLGVEGQGYVDLAHPYDRLPARAEGVVDDPVWRLSHHTAGLCVRFVTDATTIAARWRPRFNEIALPHMPAIGVSSLDVYVKHESQWHFIGVGRKPSYPESKENLVHGILPGKREYLINLPLYNGVNEVSIGLPEGAVLEQAPANLRKPICYYGTSILQGACASRPGMAYPAMLSRRLETPHINLGFSGNGKMQPNIVPFIAELDASLFVLAGLSNTPVEYITERLESMVKFIRKAHPHTPIALLEHYPFSFRYLTPAQAEQHETKNHLLATSYARLQDAGIGDLHMIPSDNFYGNDESCTVDGLHPTDMGFARIADALEPYLRELLK